jgi:hypothetical protein
MVVRHDTDGSLLAQINAAPRALVILSVPWSGPERIARAAFQEATARLATDFPQLGVECFSLDEDANWRQAWLAGLGLSLIIRGSLGAGSMVWLESGRPVSHEIAGSSLRSSHIVARTCELWAR